MRLLLAILLTLLLVSCSQVSCPGEEKDGGIGGTGDCSSAEQTVTLVQLFEAVSLWRI